MDTSLQSAGLAGDRSTSRRTISRRSARFSGALLREGDDGWSDAISVWNAMAARVPALVLQPASARDVALRSRSRATTGYAQRQGWRAQHRGHVDRGGRPDARHVGHARGARLAGREARARGARLPAARRGPGHAAARARDGARLRLRGRRRRADPRRRLRLPDAPLRLGRRQPRRGRDRHRGR